MGDFLSKGNIFGSRSIIFTKPDRPIPLYIAGLRSMSAQLAGEEGDEFVSNELNIEFIKNKLLSAVKKA